MDDDIEKLFVTIDANTKPLVEGTKQGVKQSEEQLSKLKTDQAESRFKRLATTAKASLMLIVSAIGLVTAALGAMAAGAGLAFQKAEAGLNALRIERSFRALAAGAGQASEDILAAMRKASAGTVSDLQLIAAATQALNFNIAKTPEQFAQLTESALKLARIRGIPAAEALDRLIGGLGRREVELLDELGLNLVMINAELEKLAQARLGKSADDLSAVERESLFAEAALNAAAVAAGRLGGSIEDVGSSLDQTKAAIENFTTDVDKAFLLATGKTLEIATAMNASFFGPDGIFPLFAEGGNVIAQVFAGVLANFLAVAGTIAQQVTRARDVFKGELGIGEFAAGLTPGGLAKQIGENTRTVFEQLKKDFPEILAPETIETPPTGPQLPGAPPPDQTDDAADKLKQKIADLGADLEDLQAETETRLEELASDHNDRVLEIEAEYVQDRLKLGEKLADDLEKLNEETAAERERILKDAAAELAKLEQETDRDLADERQNFDQQELRETEDHLARMRQLRQNYISSLSEAVASRDARQIVDLRRQFQEAQAKEEEGFTTSQQRRREDQDQRLAEIRQNEQDAAAAILAAREEDLAGLMENERQKREEIQASFTEQMTVLDTNRAEALAKENASYAERQAELENAMQERLESIATGLAANLEMEQQTAEQVLKLLSDTYGPEGSALAVLEAYAERRKKLLELAEAETPEVDTAATSSGPGGRTRRGPGLRSFAAGGSIIASSPTLIQVGERGTEIATIRPIGEPGANSIMTQRTEGAFKVDVNFTGLPPGMDAGALEDVVAGIMTQALREAGMKR